MYDSKVTIFSSLTEREGEGEGEREKIERDYKHKKRQKQKGYNTTMFPGGPPPQY